MRTLAASFFLVGLVAPLGAQTVAEALRAPAKKMRVADLPASYRAVALGGNELPSLSLLGFGGMGTSSDDTQAGVFFALLGATFVEPDEFAELLEGKRPRVRGYAIDLSATVMKGGGEDRKMPEPAFAETWVEAGRIVQWSPRPALSRDALLKVFSAPPTPELAEARTMTLSNAKQASLGIIMYSVDQDDKFPAADSTARAQALVEPYTKNAEIWKSHNPNGGRLLYNTSLSRVDGASLESSAETVLLWDEKPWPDGSRVVAYADGHVKVANEAEWAALWAAELRRRKAPKSSLGWARPAPIVPGVPPSVK